MWTSGMKNKMHSEIYEDYLISRQGKSAVNHSWDMPELYDSPCLVSLLSNGTSKCNLRAGGVSAMTG